jgi:hypothetical protein
VSIGHGYPHFKLKKTRAYSSTGKIAQALSFMVPELVYKFQMICLWGTQVIELKPNVGRTFGYG